MNVHGIINHVRVIKKHDLRLQNISLGIQPYLLQEFKQREHKMPVKMRCYPRRQVVLRRHLLFSCGGRMSDVPELCGCNAAARFVRGKGAN